MLTIKRSILMLLSAPCVVPLMLTAAVSAAGATERGASAAGQQPARTPDAPVKFVEKAATVDTLRLLRGGGYALYLRHGPTNNSLADRLPKVDLNDCSTQRPLTEAGRQLMTQVGAAMRQARIPLGEFKVSPLCRARESAVAAFPQMTAEVDPQLMYVANFTAEEKAPVVANTHRLLSTPVPAGTNRLVLAHAPNLTELIGYFPKEGTLVVLRPRGETAGFEYVASILPAAWPSLLKMSK